MNDHNRLRELREWAEWSAIRDGNGLASNVLALLDENDRLRKALQLAAETYHEETHPSLGPANECAVWPCNPAARAALEPSGGTE